MALPGDLQSRRWQSYVDKGADKTAVRSGNYDEATGTNSITDAASAQFETIEVELAAGITGTATSAAVDVSKYSKVAIHFNMTTSHSTDIEGSINGTDYEILIDDYHANDISGGVITSTIVTLAVGKLKFVRVNTTAVSGALDIDLLAGH